jgi:HlyD family secretion protein
MNSKKSPAEDICIAAIRVASRDGLLAMTMDNVAKEAGVSKGGLMHHFPSKEQLIRKMMSFFSEQMEQRMTKHMAADPLPYNRWVRAMADSVFPDKSNELRRASAVPPVHSPATANREQHATHAPLEPDVLQPFFLSVMACVLHSPGYIVPLRDLGKRVQKQIASDAEHGMDQLLIWLAMDGLFLWQFAGLIRPEDELYQQIAKRFRTWIDTDPSHPIPAVPKSKRARSSERSPTSAQTSQGRSPRPSAKKRGVVTRVGMFGIAIFALLVSAGAAAWYLRPRAREPWGREEDASLVSSASRMQRIHALGRLEPKGTVIEVMPRSGSERSVVERLLVNEGDDVEPGAPLAYMDSHQRRLAQWNEATARIEVSRRRLAQIEAGAKHEDIEAAREAASQSKEAQRVAKTQLDRIAELARQKQVSEEELVERKWRYDNATLEAERTKAMLQSIQTIRPTDMELGKAELAQSEAAAQSAKAELDASIVNAPSRGRILKIHTFPGESISAQGLLQMGNVNHMIAVAELYETDVERVRIGSSAQVLIDSSQRRFIGTVCDIGRIVGRKIMLSSDPVSDTDARVVEVRIALNIEDSQVLAGLSNARVEVSIDGTDEDSKHSNDSIAVQGAKR